MVFNDAARRLLVAAGPDVPVALHDWWTYLVVTACGGQVHYDPVPHVRYRQHGRNQVGVGQGWRARFSRWGRLFRGGLQCFNEQKIAALQRLRGQMPPEHLRMLDTFAQSFRRRLLGVRADNGKRVCQRIACVQLPFLERSIHRE